MDELYTYGGLTMLDITLDIGSVEMDSVYHRRVLEGGT